MSLLRLFLRGSVRRYSSNHSPLPNITPNQLSSAADHSQPQSPTNSPSTPYISQRSYGFSSAEEAAAERRRRKRRLRIEPPLYALRPNPQTPPPGAANSADRARLPDSTSVLVGPRLNLHNRVQSLIRAGDIDTASYVCRQSVFQRVRPTVFTCNAVVAAMYRAERYDDAKALFHYFFRQSSIVPNIVSYNNLIVSHCASKDIEAALEVYKEILDTAPFCPSPVTYRHLTKGLMDAGRVDEAVAYLREMLHKGHGADSLVYNNVILGFLNLGNLDKANEYFDELKERCTVYDGVVNATFMEWFFNQGKGKEAMESFRDLMSREYKMVPATRNALLETLLKHGKKKEAWDLFEGMLDDHTPPTFQAVNSDSISMMVNECFKEGNIEEAMHVFKRSGKGPKSKPFYMDVAGYNNMITRFCELEMLDEAEQYYKQLLDKSLVPDVNTFRTLIDAYIKLDNVEKVIQKYSEMAELGIRVIPPYANKWFALMIEKGKASDCLPILSKMTDREPKPDVMTYDIVIRGLILEGHFDATANLVREMMTQGIGTTSSLKEFVLGVFDGLGRRVEIENVFNITHQTSANQDTQQTSVNQNTQRQSYGNQHTQQGYANRFTQQGSQSQTMQEMAHSHPRREQEVEYRYGAGRNGV
ncbi:pentatricopeptide repeat-containing protein At1g10270-like [Salvia miltiorrhiza]|uniref:pentatricopeptide repeat-containing protein At1g10270-like n=1 Tax=Salvia miltiorrhiza TaxID=226208 RepID=UPI0025ABBC6E|nr:pentatricopeptide repeat-containing protein At1g10270-like [Salvia miltiorrhiza]XP_057772053.1 pentatricopeptide repeat-containing protein At1g10270-like [Salvia miltiorrhiza]XP_057772060.1 pentatricopeptide repeat-containing protein At1g10270-like [Salvia miltiorrhiza]XP_057772067.1 pentatricopeptide repeat-containing protein At1g10270-like [Salvia miltiorrhiza]XP_057772075.1 pentatricopeptide repeat-containing protein At1g10270-like [Salvia miltiorrhiza]XP_057772083.1 pentatricopeptide re